MNFRMFMLKYLMLKCYEVYNLLSNISHIHTHTHERVKLT